MSNCSLLNWNTLNEYIVHAALDHLRDLLRNKMCQILLVLKILSFPNFISSMLAPKGLK